jgi:hypothetical protein
MPYITGVREQRQRFPASLDVYVGLDDPVRAYDAFVEQLNFGELGIDLDEGKVGHPEFPPATGVPSAAVE